MQLSVLIPLLLAVQWKGVVLAAIGPKTACCLKTTATKVQVTQVMKYLVQDTALCPIKAVRFTTTRKDIICSDPESQWAKYAMCVVDNRTFTKKPEYRCRTITSTKPPTTTPLKPPTTTPSKPPTTPSNPPTTTSTKSPTTTAFEPPRTPTNLSKPPTMTPSKSPVTTKTVKEPSKETASTTAMTPNAPDKNSATTHKTTKQLLTTITELLQWSTPGATPRPATALTSATPQKESEARTFAMTSRHIQSSVRPETSWTEKPIASQYTPKAVTTKSHNPTSKSTTALAKAEKLPRIPWTVKRLKKKKKSGLRKAQGKRNG